MQDTLNLALDLAEALHYSGAPAWRVERAVNTLGQRLGTPLICFSVPTGIQISDGHRVGLRRSNGADIDLAAQHDLERAIHTVDPISALRTCLAQLQGRRPLSAVSTIFGYTAVSAGGAVLLGGGATTALAGTLGGLVTGIAVRLSQGKAPGLASVIPLVCSFLAALLATGVGQLLPLDTPLAIIAAIIILLPGLTLTIGVGEVAAGHLSAGAARLTGALVHFLLLGLGIAAGSGMLPESPTGIEPSAILSPTAAMLVVAAGLVVLFRARVHQIPWMLLGVALAVHLPALLTSSTPGLGLFGVAATVGLAGNALSRSLQIPAQVLTLPGILLLVPGAKGLQGVGAMLRHDPEGVSALVDSVATSGALVAGLLVAGVLFPPAFSQPVLREEGQPAV